MKRTVFVALALCLGFTSFAANDNASVSATTNSENQKEVSAISENADVEASSFGEDEYVTVRRFSAITEIGTSVNAGKPYFNIYQVVGMRVNPYFFIGQGAGIQVHNKKDYQIQALVDMRAYVLDKKVTPMFGLQMGINRSTQLSSPESKNLNDIQFALNAGSGILIKARENASFTINGGYNLIMDKDNKQHGGFVKIGYVF
ncbi:MAG: hypothetical protein R2739_03980 [Chitinophagales bacterium]|nr:hypothetical protein [Bacteroidota bacterium]